MKEIYPHNIYIEALRHAQKPVIAAVSGFALGIVMKVYCQFDIAIREVFPAVPTHPVWLEPFANQAAISWTFCTLLCIAVSLSTAPPRPDQITDQLTFNWKKMNIFSNLGDHWYSSVVIWWALFVLLVVGLLIIFSGFIIPTGTTQ